MLIPGFQTVQRREMLDCRIKSLKELLKYYGTDVSSFFVFLLAEAFSLQYGYVDFSDLSIFHIPYAVASINDVEKKLFTALKISYIEKSISANDAGWASMKSLLDAHIPIIFKIDGRIVHAATTTVPNNEKIRIHYLSSLLLVGYSQDEKTVQVILTNSKEKDTPTDFPIETFQAYRFSSCTPYSPSGTCYYLPENSHFSFSNSEIENMILLALYHTAEKAIWGDQKVVSIDGFECNSLYSGLPALKLLYKDMKEMPLHVWRKRQNNDRKRIIFSMLFLRNNLICGSYSAYREEFGIALRQFGQVYNDEQFFTIGTKFVESSKLWKKWFSIAGKLPYSKKWFSYYYHSSVRKLHKIYKIEENAFRQLYNHTKKSISANNAYIQKMSD